MDLVVRGPINHGPDHPASHGLFVHPVDESAGEPPVPSRAGRMPAGWLAYIIILILDIIGIGIL